MGILAIISTNPYYNKSIDKFKNSDLPIKNFSDYLVEQGIFSSKEEVSQYFRDTSIFYDDEKNPKNSTNSQTIEIKGKKYNRSDIQIVDFGELYEFYPTGDPERDYQIQMGLNYNKTCYDGTNYWDYEKLTAEEDFTGMSAAEIYKAVYEKYQHCYGENFIDINAIKYVRPPHSEDSFAQFIERFDKEIGTAIGSSDYADIQKARREALYGDMDDYDVRAAIIEKYAGEDGLTNSDLYKIAAEMDRCGVGGGAHSALCSVLTKDRSQVLYNSTLGIKTSVEESSAMREQMLASPADTYLVDGVLRHGKGMGSVNPTMIAAVEQLRQACGASPSGGVSVDSINADVMNKMKSNSEHTRASLTWLKPQKA